MGQKQSNLTQSRVIDVPQVKTMTRIASGSDIRYGDIQVMQSKQNQLLFAVKSKFFTDEEQWKRFKNLALSRTTDNDQFLIKQLDLQHLTEQELCSSTTKAYFVYEYYPHDLRKDIQEMTTPQVKYQEVEIVVMIYSVLSALITLHLQGQSHGDLRPATILMTQPSINNPQRNMQVHQYPLYKITNIQKLTQKNAYIRCLENTPDDYNLSPEQIQSLKMKIYHSQTKSEVNPNYDTQKSDVFSLGLVALQMGTLTDLKCVYDLNNYAILPDKISKLQDTLKLNYSPNLCKIVKKMLDFSPESRPDFMMIQENLKSYSDEIEEYFNNCNIEKLSLTYSLENFDSFPQNKHSQYKPDTLKSNQSLKPAINIEDTAPQKQVSIAPQKSVQMIDSRISGFEAMEINRELNLLDSKALEALRRSQSAQVLFNESPFQQFKAYRHQVELSTNYDCYSQLNRINIAESRLLVSAKNMDQDLMEQFQSQNNKLSSSDQYYAQDSSVPYSINNFQSRPTSRLQQQDPHIVQQLTGQQVYARQSQYSKQSRSPEIEPPPHDQTSKSSKPIPLLDDITGQINQQRSSDGASQIRSQQEQLRLSQGNLSNKQIDEEPEMITERNEEKKSTKKSVTKSVKSGTKSPASKKNSQKDGSSSPSKQGDKKKKDDPSSAKKKSDSKSPKKAGDGKSKAEKSVVGDKIASASKSPSKAEKSVVGDKKKASASKSPDSKSKAEKSLVGDKKKASASKSPSKAEKSVVGDKKKASASKSPDAKSKAEKSVVGDKKKASASKSPDSKSKAEKSVVGDKKKASASKSPAEKSVVGDKKKPSASKSPSKAGDSKSKVEKSVTGIKKSATKSPDAKSKVEKSVVGAKKTSTAKKDDSKSKIEKSVVGAKKTSTAKKDDGKSKVAKSIAPSKAVKKK